MNITDWPRKLQFRGYGRSSGTLQASTLRQQARPASHNALDLGPDTGLMLSTYITEPGQPLAPFTGNPDDR